MAIPEVTAIRALLGIIQTAREAFRSLRQEKLSATHREAIDAALDQLADAQDRIAEVQAESIKLREENNRLKDQIAAADDWKARRSEFNLVETAGGARVLQSEDKNDPYFACPACSETSQRIIPLQDLRVHSGNYKCPVCDTKYPINPQKVFEQRPPPSGWA